MPTYTFINSKTKEEWTDMMSISDMEEYVKDKNVRQVIGSPMIIGEVSGSVGRKAGDGWKEVQQRIKKGLPPRLRDNINTK